MTNRNLHVVHLLIRSMKNGAVCFLVCPHEHWRDAAQNAYWTLPTKKTVDDPLAPFLQGTSLEAFVDEVMQTDLRLEPGDYAIERELEPACKTLPSPTHDGEMTDYTIYPVDIWVDPARHEALRQTTQGAWLWCDALLAHPNISPTARTLFETLRDRHQKYTAKPPENPHDKRQAEGLRCVLTSVAEVPSMDALALNWLSGNRSGVRHLPKQTLDDILAAGSRAFNLRVADPYLRYQMQGQGFTWSFFTHKDSQDCHVHGAPVVEIYGVLEGRLEVWWKPYHDRGSSAWCHRILETGDWLEVDSLQCHIVHWLAPGMGVVFKAGPGWNNDGTRMGQGIGQSGRNESSPCLVRRLNCSSPWPAADAGDD